MARSRCVSVSAKSSSRFSPVTGVRSGIAPPTGRAAARRRLSAKSRLPPFKILMAHTARK
eukprot:scaffold45752_cov35-Tisochrysis_lutea.AAC.4